MKGRYIGEAVRTILDIMEYTKAKDIAGILLFLDFEKAFDTVDWRFLHKVLESFNFGESFRHWIKTLYNGISSCVLNNGYSTGYFEVQRGVRQGDPLSPLLFVLVVETMAIAIRSKKTIKGVIVEKEEIKLVQFADDTTISLSDLGSVKR